MEYTKGPKINIKATRETSRDNLGVNGAQTTIQDLLCPVINTVTYRAFYWIFLVWNYYDFFKHAGKKNFSSKKTTEDFQYNYLRKHDYFFVLGNIIAHNTDQRNLVGIAAASEDAKKPGPYKFNREYFKGGFGGMDYYVAGCRSFGFTTNRDRSNEEEIKGINRVTPQGEPLGKAFEDVISGTRYFKEYRYKDTEIPKDVLEELGNTIRLDLQGMDECKRLMRDALFSENECFYNKRLIESKDYLLYLYNNKFIQTRPSDKSFREVLYDYFSPRGNKLSYPDSLEYTVKAWETLVGRQYFTISIEMICKAMVYTLDVPKTYDKLKGDLIQYSTWEMIDDLEKPISYYIPSCKFSFDKRESQIEKCFRSVRRYDKNCEVGLQTMLSVYNRFKDRDDIDAGLLDVGGDVSVAEFIRIIDEMMDRPVIDFLDYVMDKWIICRNEMVALEKMFNNRDGYIFERIGSLISSTDRPPATDFQEIRLKNLLQIMADLDVVN